MNEFLKKHTASNVADMSAYTPGEQPSDTGWVKLNTNEFPYPPSPKVREAILEELGEDSAKLRLYPDPLSKNLRSAIAKFFDLKTENVIAGNGSDDILNLAVRAFSGNGKSILTLDPSYSLYPVLAKIQNAEFLEYGFEDGEKIPMEKIAASKANIFFFTNPNAPMGVAWPLEVVEEILQNFKGIVLVDEAYAPFAKESCAKLVSKYSNLIVAGTSSKGWGLAGMRIGWGLAQPEIIDVLDRVRDSYNLNRISQAAGIAAISDVEYHKKSCAKIVETREQTEKYFDSIAWPYYKSSTNFILVKPTDSKGKSGKSIADAFFNFLKSKKILVRYFPNCKPICDAMRITIGTPEQMEKLRLAIEEWRKI